MKTKKISMFFVIVGFSLLAFACSKSLEEKRASTPMRSLIDIKTIYDNEYVIFVEGGITANIFMSDVKILLDSTLSIPMARVYAYNDVELIFKNQKMYTDFVYNKKKVFEN